MFGIYWTSSFGDEALCSSSLMNELLTIWRPSCMTWWPNFNKIGTRSIAASIHSSWYITWPFRPNITFDPNLTSRPQGHQISPSERALAVDHSYHVSLVRWLMRFFENLIYSSTAAILDHVKAPFYQISNGITQAGIAGVLICDLHFRGWKVVRIKNLLFEWIVGTYSLPVVVWMLLKLLNLSVPVRYLWVLCTFPV